MIIPDGARTKLLEAAGEVFAEKGFHAATVRHIAERAGVHFTLVNYHFRDKEQLYLETVKHAYETTAARVPIPVWGPETPPQQKLRDFINTFLRRIVEDHQSNWPCRLIMREMHQPTAGCQHFAEGFARPNFEQLQGILAELLPPDTPEVRRHLVAHSIIGQCLHYRFCRPVLTFIVGPEELNSYDVDLLTDHITGFTLAALGHPIRGRKR
jgi:TetR/AcrR family transcriptional regulator, regulator of cefoperazone and chloramphenicol sensitivity